MAEYDRVHFNYEMRGDLPRLAWAASLREGSPDVRVVHGPWVEVRDHAFVEGAWDRPFEEYRFDLATTLVGSGARISDEGIVLAGHSDMHERLYVIRGDGELHVSPSLALALAISGTSLDPDEHYYLDFVNAYRAGIRDKRKRIRLQHGRSAEMHDVCNLRVTPDLRITRAEKPWGPPPRGYAEYVSLLQTTLTHVLANAADPARRQPFRPVCMISRGYDSVAVAALASRSGCREAVTYREVGSSRVDLQACKLEYSIVSPK